MCSTSHELLAERTDLSLNCRFQASDIAIRMYFSGIVILSHTQLPNNSPAILYYFAERPRCTLVKKYTPSNAVSSHGKIGRWKREKGGHDLSQFVTRGHRQCRVVGKKSDASDFCNCIGNGGRIKQLKEGMEVPFLHLPLEVEQI